MSKPVSERVGMGVRGWTLLALIGGAFPAVSAADLSSTVDHLAAVRDAELASQRTTAAVGEPAYDITVELPDFLEWNPTLPVQRLRPANITVTLRRRGGQWLPGRVTGWTTGEHRIEAIDLHWKPAQAGAPGNLGGKLSLSFDPRGDRKSIRRAAPLDVDRIPIQTERFTLETTLDLTSTSAGSWSGTCQRAAQAGFGASRTSATAEVTSLAQPSLPESPTRTDPSARLADCWRQLVGLEWMARNAGSWPEAQTRIPDLAPVGPGDTATQAAWQDLAGRVELALQDRATRPAQDLRRGPGGCEDPEFGPFFADQALATSPSADGVLPEVTATGPQEWRFISRWHVLSPIAGGPDLHSRPGWLAPILADPRLPMRSGKGDVLPWRIVGPPAGAGQGRALVRSAHAGLQVVAPWIDPIAEANVAAANPDPGSGYIAVADLESALATEIWLGTALFEHGLAQRLYVNERLVMESSVVDDPGNIRPSLMRVPLRPGRNRILLHAAVSRYSGTLAPFLVAVCIQGGPRSAQQVQEDHRRQQQLLAAADAARRHLRGNMTDGRGQHPDASPVRAWNLDAGINVVWRTTLPEASSANVLVLGRKVLVTGEPHVLTCLDADTGAVLWRRVSSRFELLDPTLVDEAERLRRSADDAREVLAKAVRPKDERDLPDPLSAPERKSLYGRIDSWQKILDRLGDQRGRRKITWDFPWYHASSWAPPVSDGKWVWVKFGTGVVACYDLDGNRRWLVATGHPVVGERCAPVLADGILVLMLPRRYGPSELVTGKAPGENNSGSGYLDGDLRNYELVGLDAATGAERWRTPVKGGGNEGSPIIAHATNGSLVVPVVVTPLGSVIRVADGRFMAERSGPEGCSWQIPYADGNLLAWTMAVSGSVVAGRLVLKDRDHLAIAPAWLSYNQGQTQMQQAGVYTVSYRGRICTMNPGLGCSQDMVFQVAAVMDLATGTTVHRIQPVFHDGGWTHMPHASAKDVMLFGQTEPASPHIRPHLNLAVTSLGDRPRVLARNHIPKSLAAPVCDGDRIYLRAGKEVICLGRVGPDGAAYERRQQARTLVEETIPTRPMRPSGPITDLVPDQVAPPDGAPVWRVSSQTAPGRWVFAGPFPEKSPPLGNPATARLIPNQVLRSGQVEQVVHELGPELVKAKQGDLWYRGAMLYGESNGIDILKAIGRQPESLAYYATTLLVTRPTVVQVELRGGTNATAWMSGRLISDGGLYRLAPGFYHWLVAVTIRRLPPIETVMMGPRLLEQPDHDVAMQRWRNQVRAYRAELQQVTVDDPESREAVLARRLLSDLDEGSSRP